MKHIEAADEVWHAGDIGDLAVAEAIEKIKPLKAVYGNIDGARISSRFPKDIIFLCESVKVYITHIGGYPGKYPARIKKQFEKHRPQLFICGHSHILKVMHDPPNALLHMNPGACGAQGFHAVRTALKFEVDGSEIKNLAVIELGARTSLPS
jgi:putative phosphoesterase